MSARLQKTSLQLPPDILGDFDRWPGISRSEALRLAIERGHYLSCLNAQDIAGVAEEYDPILREALEDLDYEDYRLAARSLPQIVEGFLNEALSEGSGRSWKSELSGHDVQLDPTELVKRLGKMNILERIGILDCVTAERYRKRANEGKASSSVLERNGRNLKRKS